MDRDHIPLQTAPQLTWEELDVAIGKARQTPPAFGESYVSPDMCDFTRIALTGAYIYAGRHPGACVLQRRLLVACECYMYEFALVYDPHRRLFFRFEYFAGSLWGNDYDRYQLDPHGMIMDWYTRCPREALDGHPTADACLQSLMSDHYDTMVGCYEKYDEHIDYENTARTLDVVYDWLDTLGVAHGSHEDNERAVRPD